MSDTRKKAFEEIHDKIYSMRRVMTPEKPHMYALGALVAYDDMAKWLYSEMLEMDEDSLLLRPGLAELQRREALSQARAEGRREGIEEGAKWMISHSYATGRGDTIEDLFAELEWQLLDRAVKVVEDRLGVSIAKTVAKDIRALATPAGKER